MVDDLVVLEFDVDKAAAGDPIPEGTYQFQISKSEKGVSNSGNPKLHVESDVINHPEQTGRRIFEDIALTPKAAFKLKQFCQSAGIDYRQPLQPSAWVGKTFWADVAIVPPTYDNTTGEEVYPAKNKVAKYRVGA